MAEPAASDVTPEKTTNEHSPKYSAQAVHLVRTATQSNLTLSQMADQKASMLMGATFLVFTIAVGQASRGQFSAALVVLAFFALLSAVFAIVAVAPSVRASRHNGGASNLLFFGVFSHMSEDEFIATVKHELVDDELIYSAMLRDIYQNGQVLQKKKYRFVGYAYVTFLVGLTLTFAIFLYGMVYS
ncbi:hypothetical protein EKN06_10100 [Croceicoccus ponticola]|uniref:Pycsar effector protein domain-containing protein n=1 Tax=Croceicoccus ponticola TaxID=2217664 RepID=A0A437GW68_9SPHN|nr:Pycsar system effector family protein [Croceicoccus ponticola]RVQ66378.1 hypothetical protein EKN06_10100 [Croceicoccus ponticola]